MRWSDEIGELIGALAKAQGEFRNAVKDSNAQIQMKAGGGYNYKFADLANVVESCRAALSSNGLAVMQPPEWERDGTLILETIIAHSSGQWIASSMTMPVNESDIKKVGSAITYLRRYALMSTIGVVAEDDDGSDAPAITQRKQGRADERGQGERNGREQLPTSRAEVNAGFAPATRALPAPKQESGRASKETTKLPGDRIGAKGLDVRDFTTLTNQEVERANQAIGKHRSDLQLEHLDGINSFEFTRHMVKATVAANAPDPEPIDEATGKHARVGIGKLGAHLARLYLDAKWRDWMREETREYLERKVVEATQEADNEAHGDAPGPDAEDVSQEEPEAAQLVGANGEAWTPGRE